MEAEIAARPAYAELFEDHEQGMSESDDDDLEVTEPFWNPRRDPSNLHDPRATACTHIFAVTVQVPQCAGMFVPATRHKASRSFLRVYAVCASFVISFCNFRVQGFSDDDQVDSEDTTAVQARHGKDIQVWPISFPCITCIKKDAEQLSLIVGVAFPSKCREYHGSGCA